MSQMELSCLMYFTPDIHYFQAIKYIKYSRFGLTTGDVWHEALNDIHLWRVIKTTTALSSGKLRIFRFSCFMCMSYMMVKDFSKHW